MIDDGAPGRSLGHPELHEYSPRLTCPLCNPAALHVPIPKRTSLFYHILHPVECDSQRRAASARLQKCPHSIALGEGGTDICYGISVLRRSASDDAYDAALDRLSPPNGRICAPLV